MGPHYEDFTFAFDTTLIRLEITEIWPEYVVQTSPPQESSAQRPPGDRVKYVFYVISYVHGSAVVKIM